MAAMSSSAHDATPAGGRPTVVVISDSLTNDEPDNWLAAVARVRPRLTVIGEAHGGWSTNSYFKAKFDGVAWARLPDHADVAIILLGSNNLFEDGGGSDAAVADAVEGVQKIEAFLRRRYPNMSVILTAPPTCVPERAPAPAGDRYVAAHSPRFIEKLGNEYRALAARRGWGFVDLFPVLVAPDDYHDLSHPNAQGNQKIAEAMLPAIDARMPQQI